MTGTACTPRAPALCSIYILCLLTMPHVVAADLLGVGTEFQANTYTTGDQGGADAVAVARAPSGAFVVVWSSNQDGDNKGVFGQVFDSTGTPEAPEFQINTYTSYRQGEPLDVSMAADGRFVVVWSSDTDQDGDGRGVFAQRFEATGEPDGTEFQVNTYTTNDQGQYACSVASAADGRFVVVWNSDEQDGNKGGTFARRYDSSGAPEGTEFRVNTYTTGFQADEADVASAADGSFVVAWTSAEQDGDGYGLFGQRFDSAGAPDGAEFQINTYTTGSQGIGAGRVSMSATPAGAFIVVWTGESPVDTRGIRAQRFEAAGNAVGVEFQVNAFTTDSQYRASVAMDADGAFVVAWNSPGIGGDDVFAQRFEASGAANGYELQLNTYTTGDQGDAATAIATDGTGNFVVAWESDNQDGSGRGAFARRFCTDEGGDGNCEMRCPVAATAMCETATLGKLGYKEKKPGKESAKLLWKKIAGATTQSAFGDPVGTDTSVALCIYDDAAVLVTQLNVDRAGDLCIGKDCWKAKGPKGYGYKDKDAAASGVTKLNYVSGAPGKGKADAQGKNNAVKSQMSLPTGVVAGLTGNAAPTIQMLTSDGLCIGATMNVVKKDKPGLYSALLK